MSSESLLIQILELVNEILTAGIVVITASMLLYNLSRRSQNSVTRASSVLLAAVTAVFLGDVWLALGPSSRPSVETWLRLQWVGIAFVPAATFHLSDALLATTGRVSRWRRRLGVRLLYGLAAAFMIAAALTNQVVRTLALSPAPHLKAGAWFPVFMFYALSASALALYNVARARNRCLTTLTRRRMTYMLVSILSPLLGVLPYTSFANGATPDSTWFWIVVNVSNVAVIVMVSFMAYPLSFFGSEVPDRAIKAELLEFFLRGPFVGVATLAVIIGLPRAGDILGLPGREIMPLAAVATLIFLEWAIGWVIPTLEDWLIYLDDKDEIRRIRGLSERLLTRSDLDQLLEGILASACDYLRVSTAFVASATADGPALERAVGPLPDKAAVLSDATFTETLSALAQHSNGNGRESSPVVWDGFWVTPLWSERMDEDNGRALLGVMAVQARAEPPALTDDERATLRLLAARAERVVRDMRLQVEVSGYLEGLMPEIDDLDQLRWVTRYRQEPRPDAINPVNMPDFAERVKDALGHYWGGPRLTQSDLLRLRIVQKEQAECGGNAAQALRAVLLKAVESLRPEGNRSLTAAEWTLYNILEMRFIQGRKVREVARRLAMSESDFYRKQRIAINEVARIMAAMEYDVQQ